MWGGALRRVPFSFVSFLLGKQKEKKEGIAGRERGPDAGIRPLETSRELTIKILSIKKKKFKHPKTEVHHS
jgi:hypothetical protein